ncbi:hypothetical protein WN66_04766 [Saccharomyces cerevisiae]|nr:hypothetical protein WN66_04766 [Saccharomyces cerevisiae]
MVFVTIIIIINISYNIYNIYTINENRFTFNAFLQSKKASFAFICIYVCISGGNMPLWAYILFRTFLHPSNSSNSVLYFRRHNQDYHNRIFFAFCCHHIWSLLPHHLSIFPIRRQFYLNSRQ